MITRLEDIVDRARQGPKRTVVVPMADDLEVLQAIKMAMDQGLIDPFLLGPKKKIEVLLAQVGLVVSPDRIVDEELSTKAATLAVDLVKHERGAILMKGLLSTADFLRPIVNKDNQLVKNGLLSHVALIQSPYYHKLLCITDAAMNIQPGFVEKVKIIENAVGLLHSLGNSLPKVAVLGPVETVNHKIESTEHAAMLSQMNREGQMKECLVDGPLALDNAISMEAAHHKGIKSEVAGDADILLAPDLNSGNILYKSALFLGGSSAAAIIAGARVPIVLTSRADSSLSKFYSIALAVATFD
jgi:phosphate butyryltransferase